MSETSSSHHCTSEVRALSTSQDFGKHLWDYFSGSNLNKIKVSPSACGLCFVVCLDDRPNLLFLKSTEFLPPRGWSNKMTFALSWYHVEWCRSDYVIRVEMERNCMLLSHPRCRLDLVVLHICLALHKKTRSSSIMTIHISKLFMSMQCVHCTFLHLINPMALHCLALPISAPHRVLSLALGVQSSQNQTPQPMGISGIPQEGFILDISKLNKLENWLKQEKWQGGMQLPGLTAIIQTLVTLQPKTSLYSMQLWPQNTSERDINLKINQRCGRCSWTSAR